MFVRNLAQIFLAGYRLRWKMLLAISRSAIHCFLLRGLVSYSILLCLAST